MHIETGINLSAVYKIDELDVAIMATYQLLDVQETNGCVSSEARTSDLILTFDAAQEIIKSARLWVNWIISVQKITVKDFPDNPYELTVSVSAPGMNYNIEMETLDQTIVWDNTAKTFTLLSRQAYDISIEAFIYYLDTLDDLLNGISNL